MRFIDLGPGEICRGAAQPFLLRYIFVFPRPIYSNASIGERLGQCEKGWFARNVSRIEAELVVSADIPP